MSDLYHENMSRISELEEQKCSLAFELKDVQEQLDEALGRIEWLSVRLEEETQMAATLREQVLALGYEPQEITLTDVKEEPEEEVKEEEEDEDQADDVGVARRSIFI